MGGTLNETVMRKISGDCVLIPTYVQNTSFVKQYLRLTINHNVYLTQLTRYYLLFLLLFNTVCSIN